MSSLEPQSQAKPVPVWIRLFCFALMGPAMGINTVFVALSLPSLAQYGTTGLVMAGFVGIVLGILPAEWLARRIHQGLSQ